ncbi:hypothetical protein EVG20_g6478 [Dentipellis fragilis]|uniref:Uncharacterized protein n=1 Tax=Dentipellis fragilis TaxID=205917 RepID=A0A4Y9YMZ4_9AGAM|nr:hypothetical protein EVG20_g6478 [Dentipellis fragilis]
MHRKVRSQGTIRDRVVTHSSSGSQANAVPPDAGPSRAQGMTLTGTSSTSAQSGPAESYATSHARAHEKAFRALSSPKNKQQMTDDERKKKDPDETQRLRVKVNNILPEHLRVKSYPISFDELRRAIVLGILELEEEAESLDRREELQCKKLQALQGRSDANQGVIDEILTVLTGTEQMQDQQIAMRDLSIQMDAEIRRLRAQNARLR